MRPSGAVVAGAIEDMGASMPGARAQSPYGTGPVANRPTPQFSDQGPSTLETAMRAARPLSLLTVIALLAACGGSGGGGVQTGTFADGPFSGCATRVLV